MKIYFHDLKDIRNDKRFVVEQSDETPASTKHIPSVKLLSRNDRTIILKSEEDKMMEQKKQELVRCIQDIGESLIKNAESIVGSEKYLKNIYISVNLNDQEEPSVEVTKEFLPEKFIERTVDFVK